MNFEPKPLLLFQYIKSLFRKQALRPKFCYLANPPFKARLLPQ